MMILIIMLFGTIAFSRLGLDMMPELEYPAVSVVTTYEGVSSEDIENLITKPIEGVVSSIKNVKNVTSTSQEGVSAVIVEFEWGVTLDFAAQDVREKLSWLTDYLPDDADSPLVVKFNTSDYPILYYGVTGMEDTRTLRKYLIDNIKPRLERLEGVASVYIMGGLEREINIFVDRD
ncbi:MAG: efflux RND transporter permease subunit, partial [Deltaproteobacteria bacterium]|nr:efflux RND transporter permease subunit [Deltaproteobacteria bacterium]